MAKQESFKDKVIGLFIMLAPPIAAAFFPEIEDGGGLPVMAATLTGIATLTVLISEPIKIKWNLEGWGARIMSWVLATALIFLSSLAGWAFEAYEWYMYIISGVGVGLAANGVFTIEQVKAALNTLYSILKPEQSE